MSERCLVPGHLMEPYAASTEHYVLRVVGEAMIEEGIFDGDYIVVLRMEAARPGDMVVCLVGDDDVTMKRYYPEGEYVRLQPANRTLRPIYPLAKDVKVQGVVVGLMRKYERGPL